MAAFGVNKVSVVASLMLLLFISSSLAVMAAGADAGLCDHMCIPDCHGQCVRGNFLSGQCEVRGGRYICCCYR
ncbi:hypothetical protein MRB53_003763 [Persea americana]|uniref:Uncharacterized protein n=3 Tax=Persea americana TaxID=3435 RepID=A0ACC2MY90_PERAE|nr:hypothetical protein MRB53_003748 [Persea americana]KAJ8650737.1 hypothetical protein MRB53_003760 [Persea americana]KAJ8650740.1 hypothetical protein MRB53_003763 [Persea americana]